MKRLSSKLSSPLKIISRASALRLKWTWILAFVVIASLVVFRTLPVPEDLSRNKGDDRPTNYKVGAEKNGKCPLPTNPNNSPRWRNFVDTIAALEEVQAPYQLHAGTLLNFIRDCDLRSDLDFALPGSWQAEHEDSLVFAMATRGFVWEREFGNLDDFAYEQSFLRDGIRVDIFGIDNNNKDGTHFDWGIWSGVTGVHRCSVPRTSISKPGQYSWGPVNNIRIPIPFDGALQSLYGMEWRLPYPGKWHYLKSAIEIGSCNATGSLGTVDMGK